MITSSLARSRKTRAFTIAPLVLAGTMCLLSACSSSVTDAASEMGSKGRKVGLTGGGGSTSTTTTPTPTPTSTPTPTATAVDTGSYDASIGNGVDANGFADLPLRAGDHRYFVNSSTGSDNNSCAAAQSPATPKKTAAGGFACIADGTGDQLLIAEGTTYAEKLPSMAFRTGGVSLLYPFVIESYDPSDPLNEAKYGRASGSSRPVFTQPYAPGTPWIFGGTHQSFIAIRGLDLNPGNISGPSLSMVAVGDGILFENNLLRYTGLAFDVYTAPKAHHWIIRNNAIYGEWDASTATAGQGVYADGSDSLTIEDNVFYHNGWKIGANRTDTLANGGATEFRHPIYQQVPTDAVVRRNLIIDGSGDGGSFRGNITHYENLIIDCPIGASLGGGVNYNTGRPNGVTISSHDNAIIGSAAVPDTGAAGWGIVSENGTPGSSAFRNLILRDGMGGTAFLTSAIQPQPSYMDYSNNVVFQWSTPGQTHYDGAADPYQGQAHATYNNNIWDDPTSGTNTNNGGVSFANAYTAAQLYAALAYTDKQSFVTYAITHPEAHIQRTARALLFAGYGL